MNTIITQYHQTPIGEFIVGSLDDKLCLLDYRYRRMRQAVDKRLQKGLNATFVEGISETNQLAIKQLDEFLAGKRQAFDLPLAPVGTDFQHAVWQALMEIPFGETWSYAELAKHLGDPNAVRAVATANGANAIAIIIPCHRVIGSDGSLTGYAGGLPAEKKLLTLERPDLFSAA
jgi:methylated-DNA-[protein]-cysteine S-methyltransferase